MDYLESKDRGNNNNSCLNYLVYLTDSKENPGISYIKVIKD